MNARDTRIRIMRDEKISLALLKLGMPIMVGMMVNALYNVVDAYFVGGLGTSQMGAVSVVFPIVQIVIGLGMTFGSGAASYISRLLGEKNTEKANKTASTALFSSLFVGVTAIIVSLCFLDNILLALGATETILPFARAYALIYISGSILNIFNVTMNNIVTSEGAAKMTMTAMLIGGGLNVILDPIFIYLLSFGIQGAAIATVVAQGVTTLLYVLYILRKKGYLRFSVYSFALDGTIYGEIFKVGIPTFMFQLLFSTAMGLTNTMASVYGDSAMAAMGVVTRIMALGTYVVFGYMKGFQPVAGYNYGAKSYDRLREAIKLSLIWATIFCGITALVMIVLPEQIVSLFSQNDAVLIEIGGKALRANGIVFIFFGFQMVYMSLFLALGRGKEGGILSISRQGLFFIPAILIMPGLLGIGGVIYAQPVADALTVVLTAIFVIGFNRKLKVLKGKFNTILTEKKTYCTT
ncbi:MATE family efflux transporter [Halocella sp. SP3-1]|uniref:MATE family efflux transporter n=1 Tax=Halocella sp. SP3-1 TaxID=2382161 RepID=UPI000F755AC9|nr:MATE family efflux transporter [Halocella sp. SP3-1]AZO95967.1 MATE family efflux transporter [Halocella sp. SP3-1]